MQGGKPGISRWPPAISGVGLSDEGIGPGRLDAALLVLETIGMSSSHIRSGAPSGRPPHGPGHGLAALTAHATESDWSATSTLLRGLLANAPPRPRPLGRLHPGGLLPPARQGPRRRAGPEPGPGRGHPRASRAGPGHRHGPQARPARQEAPGARRPAAPPARPRRPRPPAPGAGRDPRGRPPRRADGPAGPDRRALGPGPGPPEIAQALDMPWPASATEKTRPSASSNATSTRRRRDDWAPHAHAADLDVQRSAEQRPDLAANRCRSPPSPATGTEAIAVHTMDGTNPPAGGIQRDSGR
jgi:hypothetical protein